MTGKTNNRIGILGGTFNPVHLGHLALAGQAIEAYDLARTLFIPSAKPPHKTLKILASVEHRLAMLRLAVKDNAKFEVCDIEIRRGGPSYTIDTITELKKLNPAAEYYFIIGADSLLELHMWKDIGKLLKLCRFVTFGRPGVDTGRVNGSDIHLDPPWPGELLRNVTAGPMLDISSSNIRRMVAEGASIRYLVPKEVEEYIAGHKLYAKQ